MKNKIGQIKPFDMTDYLKAVKAPYAKLLHCKPEDLKLVGVKFQLLDVKHNVLAQTGLFAEGFDEDEYDKQETNDQEDSH